MILFIQSTVVCFTQVFDGTEIILFVIQLSRFFQVCGHPILRLTRHKIDHFVDILHSQSLGVYSMYMQKLSLTQQKQTTQELNDKSTQKANLNLKKT